MRDVGTAVQKGITYRDAANLNWDVVVVGAGVAGAAYAVAAARLGQKVLVIESQAFPREKVCGGCLNPRAQRHLEKLGVLEGLRQAGAVAIGRMHVHVRNHVSRWSVPAMLSVRRSTLDSMLMAQAIEAGAVFLTETRGTLEPRSDGEGNDDDGMRAVRLTPVASLQRSTAYSSAADSGAADSESQRVVSPRVVVAAGLSRSALPREESWQAHTADDSRVGVQCLIHRERLPANFPIDQDLHMLVGRWGYLGIGPVDGGWLDLAAALDPSTIKRAGGIGPCVQSILDDCQLSSTLDLRNEAWLATPLLTRESQQVANDCVFLLGDSAGYVEPFTGEGMSWALAGAEALSRLGASQTHTSPMANLERDWSHWVHSHRRKQQSLAKWVARRARSLSGARMVLQVLDWMPPVRNFLIRKAMR